VTFGGKEHFSGHGRRLAMGSEHHYAVHFGALLISSIIFRIIAVAIWRAGTYIISIYPLLHSSVPVNFVEKST
jgi:hypothetical protein